jgi:hypothetical protein
MNPGLKQQKTRWLASNGDADGLAQLFIFIIYRINQDQLVTVCRFVETDRPFFNQYF